MFLAVHAFAAAAAAMAHPQNCLALSAPQGVMALQSPEDVVRAQDAMRQLSTVLSQQSLLAPLELSLRGLSHFERQVLHE